MKTLLILIMVLAILPIANPGWGESEEAAKTDADKVRAVLESGDQSPPKTVREAIEGLKPDDPRKAKVELLTWRIKYLQEHLRAIELEYTGLCYKDRRHRQSSLELERLNRELRQLLLLK